MVYSRARGKVKIYLPDDMAASDTISGTVAAEPSGKTDEEKQRNAGELQGYVVEFENQKSTVSGVVIPRIHLALDQCDAAEVLSG